MTEHGKDTFNPGSSNILQQACSFADHKTL